MVTLRGRGSARLRYPIVGPCLVGAGTFLLLVNLFGLCLDTVHQLREPRGTSAARSELRELIKSEKPFDLPSATHLVHAATVHSDDRRIGLTENWLQWIVGRCYSPLSHVQLTHRLLAGSLANCSERAQILKSLAEAAGLPCRFVGLSGHVVLEVFQNGKWQVADPGYDIVYPTETKHLEQPEAGPEIRSRLALAEYKPGVIDGYLRILQSADDNIVLPVGGALSPRLYAVEVACDWLAWLLPMAAVVVGAGLMAPAAARVRPAPLAQAVQMAAQAG